MKILHIDDNMSVFEAIGFLMRRKGHEYQSETDGKKGLQLIRENHYDIILLDMAMPGFSGMDVINGLYNDGSIRTEKIVIFTAHKFTEEKMKELRNKGVHSSLGKPVINEKLLEKLKMIEDDFHVTTNIKS